ncbi:hypothetical protein [Arthrobacter sp. B3I4]|uniref:hypothetical protein n=1 Tax=Arthrobacter sp. B3I4 TaxID=3042267 RepID=UPI00277F5C43|nr:hypothetical protein [Arthrobacter sp. B3I4]MDQ0756815.1 hypothetical protein [Arthrobacter sp. B3I4]
MTKSDSGTPDPDSGANQDDAVWLDLVARLESTDSGSGTEAGAHPVSGQAPGPRAFRDFDPLGLAAPPPAEAPAAGPRDAGARDFSQRDSGQRYSGPRDYEPDDDDGAFIPEEPPSLAGSDPLTVLAWLGAVGGPIALLLSAMFWRSAPLLAVMGIVAAFAVSVVFLILKLPHEKDEHDDGARV